MNSFPAIFQTSCEIGLDYAQRYAAISGDYNPLHLNSEFAKALGFKGPILHGLCTAALVAARVTEQVAPANQLRQLRFRFSEPVYPGDRLHIQGTQIENGTYRLACRNQHKTEVLGSVEIIFSEPNARILEAQALDYQNRKHLIEEIEIDSQRLKQFSELMQTPMTQVAPPLFCGVYTFRTLLKFAARVGIVPQELAEERPQFAAAKIPEVVHASQNFDFFQTVSQGEKLSTAVCIDQERMMKGKRLVYFNTESRNISGHRVHSGRWLIIISA